MKKYIVFYKTWDDIFTHSIMYFDALMEFIQSANYEYIFHVKEIVE